MVIIIPRTMGQLKVLLVIGAVIGGFILYQEYQLSLLDNFQTRQELTTFLAKDHTDQLVWSEDFTCEDFTKILISNAKEEGYRLHVHDVTDPNLLWPNEDFYLDGDDGHAMCKALIESEGVWVVIEPQNDSLLAYRSN